MKYTVDTPKPDWSKYKYYPHLDSSEDLLKGGWILHRMAPGSTERYDDYLRCQSIDTRFARTMKLTQSKHPPYQPKYNNWYGLQFPMLQIDVLMIYNGSVLHDNLPADKRQVCNMAEKHLLMDQIFEQFVYDKIGRCKDEWGTFTSIEKDTLLMQFKVSKRADDANLREHLTQAEFDPHYRAKQ